MEVPVKVFNTQIELGGSVHYNNQNRTNITGTIECGREREKGTNTYFTRLLSWSGSVFGIKRAWFSGGRCVLVLMERSIRV